MTSHPQNSLIEQSESASQSTILLVDDEPEIAAIVGEVLRGTGYRVAWVRTVSEARIATTARAPDLVLLDIQLNQETGFDYLRWLRADPTLNSVPVAMLTVSQDPQSREQALTMGADRYVVKPISPDALMRAISELLSSVDDLWFSVCVQPAQVGSMRKMLIDTVTDLPTLPLVVEQLRSRMGHGEDLAVFCIELEPLFRIDERADWETFDQLRRNIARLFHVVLSSVVGPDPVFATSHAGANDFYIFARLADVPDPQRMSRHIEKTLHDHLRRSELPGQFIEQVAIFVGASSTRPYSVYAPRLLYNCVREAKDDAEKRESRYFSVLGERLRRTMREQAIRTVFQPLFDLQTMSVVGYEALSRGPAGTELESPEVIFDLARELDLVWELEALCIENVAPVLDSLCSRGLLFFNLESRFIQQIEARGTTVLEALRACHGGVVIEVTERSAIRDFGNFRQTLSQIRQLGFKVAVDDCGSGYASLEAVAELKPDYMKVGHGLFRGIESDTVRRRVVNLIARCAEDIGATVVAEAIETEEQLAICRDLGIGLGQGYLLQKPAPWSQFES